MTAVAFHSRCGCQPRPAAAAPARLHILRDKPRRRSYRAESFRRPDAEVGWCGTAAWGHRHDITPLPGAPPPGLVWCGACVGRYADHIGQLGRLAALLAESPGGAAVDGEVDGVQRSGGEPAQR